MKGKFSPLALKMDLEICIILVLLQTQMHKSEARYCQEAVASAALVVSCPTSKIEWDTAARKKNCSRIALQQTCAPVEKFRYHCVINGYRNETLEVCAPTRIIFGHCVEFNLLGGLIQDQWSSPCKDTFPKCDDAYNSTAAYKYPDCYTLVFKNWNFPTTGKMPIAKIDVIITTTTTNELDPRKSMIIILTLIILITVGVVTFVIGRRLTSIDADLGETGPQIFQFCRG